MTTNELNSKADFNPAKHQHDAGFRNPEPTHDADKSDVVFLSMAQAAKMTGYHQDYLGQMARSGKLEAMKVGRNWQTTKLAIDKMLGRVPKEDPKPTPQPVVQTEVPKIEIAPAQTVEVPKAAVQTEAPKIIATPEVVVAPATPSAPAVVKTVAMEIPKPVPPAPPKVPVLRSPPPVPKLIIKPPVAAAPVEKISEPVSQPVAVSVPKPQPVAVSIPKPVPVAEKIVPKFSTPQPLKISTPQSPIQQVKPISLPKKVHINHYPLSKEAGPNLQELIAGYNQEDLVQYTEIEIDNREKLLHWNKIAPEYNPKKNNFTPNRVKEFTNLYPEKTEPVVEKRVRPVWTYAAVGVTTFVLLTAGYFASTFMNPLQDSSLNAFVLPQRMVAGESTSVQEPVTGKAVIPVGATEFVVKDKGVNSDSTILITLRENFGGRYWVAGQRDGEFILKLSEPIKTKTPFDYMILADEEGGTE